MNYEANQPLVSVIVPVYGVEPFIAKCIQSLVDQTYPNLEIILVDDGTKDKSGEICDAYADRYPQLKVIHQENRGLCGARNTGLRHATGSYVGFVDSDDWCAPDMYEYLVKNALSYDADVTACRYYRVRGNEPITSRCTGMDTVFDKDGVIEEIVTKFEFRTVFWNKIFRKEMFDGMQFPEGRVFEGTLFMHKLLLEKAEKCVLLGDPKYYYIDNENSIVNAQNIISPLNYAASYISRYYDLRDLYPGLRKVLLADAIDAVAKLPHKYKLVTDKAIQENRAFFDIVEKFINENMGEIEKNASKLRVQQMKLMSHSSHYTYKKAHDKNGFNDRYNMLMKGLGLKKKKRRRSISHEAVMTPERQKKLTQLQGVLVEILAVIDDLCRKNGLHYYLYGGTLLGAVRDGHIIAWDDDMDLVMYRDDYEKFKEICKTQLPEGYFYQDCFTDPGYPMLSSKIRKNDTYVREEKWDDRKMHKGIFVDILPLDYFPNNKVLGYCMLHWMSFLHQLCAFEGSHSTKLPVLVLYKICKTIPVTFWYKLRYRSMKLCNRFSRHDKVCSFGSHYQPVQRRVLQSEWFGEPCEMEFENMSCMAPGKWEGYLLHLFGKNYRQLPPVKDRVCHGDLDSIRF